MKLWRKQKRFYKNYEIKGINLEEYRKYIYILLVLTMIICIIYLPSGHDMKFHIYRIGSIVENLKWKGLSGFPYHIYTTSFHGYGYGAPLFYGDIFLYFPAFLTVLGLDIYVSYKIFIVTIFFFSFLAMYCSIQSLQLFTDIKVNRDFAVLAAIFYIYSPAYIENLWIRSAIGESLASIFLPVVFCMIYKITVQNDWKFCHIIWLSLGIAGLLLSHVITTVITAFFAILFLILHSKNLFQNPIKILGLLIAALLSFCLTAYYVIPFLEQYIVMDLSRGIFLEDYKERTIPWKYWFLSFQICYKLAHILNIEFKDEWSPSCIGYSMAAMIYLVYCYYQDIKRKEIVHYSMFAFLLLVLISIKSFNQWTGEKLFAYKIQFPWRLLVFIFFLIAITVSYLLICINKRRLFLIISVIMIVSAGFPTISLYGYSLVLILQGKEQEERGWIREYDPNRADSLYLPEEVNLKKVRLKEGKVSGSKGISFQVDRDIGSIHILVTSNKNKEENRNNKEDKNSKRNKNNNAVLNVPFIYYKGYAAENETTGKQYIVEKNSQGYLKINIGNDTGNIVVFYKGTKLQKISNYISFICCIFYLLQYVCKASYCLGIIGYDIWKNKKT